MTRLSTRIGRCVLQAMVVAVVSACGWHAGLNAPPGAGSVGVEIFDNQTLERNLEPRLAASLASALVSFVDVEVRAPEHADAVVRGRILEFRRRPGVRSPQNELLETGVQIVVEASLVDRRSGTVLRESRRRLWSSYALGEQDGDLRASERALENLTEKLVLDLFAPVTYESEP